jgi:uncharacterized NAD-dependent epimerase/dehydratase family protein
MTTLPEGQAIIYCEGSYSSPNGKTAHGLIRRSERYRVRSVVDSHHAGEDAGIVLDNMPNNIPIYRDVDQAVTASREEKSSATHLVIGLAPDGGRLNGEARRDVMKAIRLGLHVDSGLHDFLTEDEEIHGLGKRHGIQIRDVRKPPPRQDLHFFTGKIDEVKALKVAILGTDSAVGKRTTAWLLLDAIRAAGYKAELIGTGQTAWMQGARYSIILDSLVNDFVSGEIEHAIWRAWNEQQPDVIVIEGQGSLMNPAYPGGFEILAAGRPDAVVLQHAPRRKDYDGFPGYPIQPLQKQIEAIQLISGRQVAAITLNHENLEEKDIPNVCVQVLKETGLPTCDVLFQGASTLVKALQPFMRSHDESNRYGKT